MGNETFYEDGLTEIKIVTESLGTDHQHSYGVHVGVGILEVHEFEVIFSLHNFF